MTIIRDKDGLVMVHIANVKQTLPQGAPPILIEKNHDCKECGQIHDLERCPKCNSWITPGFGLMGGGFGSYWLCDNDDCDWFRKECEENLNET